MARPSLYANAVFPSSAMFTAEDETCCNEATGATAAATAQQYPSDDMFAGARNARAGGAGGWGVVSDLPAGFQRAAAGGAAAAVAVVPTATGTTRARGACRCWLVALAAVVLIAVVAKS
jgi:hypothetical protein